MQSILRSACLLALIAAPVCGQSASFQFFGSGCNGATLNRCIVLNDQNAMLTSRNLTNEYAHAAVNSTGGAVTVVGVDFFTAAVTSTSTPVTVPIAFYWDSLGVATSTPVEPAELPQTLGNITASPTPNWYRGDFDRPVIVPAGSAFWVSADTNGISPPDNANGSGALRVSHWRRPGFVGGGWSTTTLVANPAYRIRCLGSANVPILVNNGVPRLGSTYSVELYNAPAAVTGGFHLIGNSRTSWAGIPLPVDLTVIGATSCELLTSINVSLLRPVTAGHASVPFRVPNNPALVGASLDHQWLLLAPGLTPLGLVFSNGGESVLGGL